MALVAAKCSQCGAILEVDNDKDAAICKHCGTPFIIEKAINYYNLEVGPSADTLLKLARRARDDNNADEGIKYYEQLLLAEPDSWEATFFSRYFRASKYKLEEIEKTANLINQSIDTTLSLIKEKVPDRDEQMYALAVVSEHTNKLLEEMYDTAKRQYLMNKNVYHEDMQFAMRACSCIAALVTFGNDEYRFFKDDPYLAQICIGAKGIALKMIMEVNNLVGKGQKSLYDDMLSPMIKDCVDMIKRFEPDFVAPQIQYRPAETQTNASTTTTSYNSSSGSSGGGCLLQHVCMDHMTVQRFGCFADLGILC